MSRVLVAALLMIASAVSGQSAYPDWFLTPPASGWVAIFANSESEATTRASELLSAYEASHVVGDFQQFYDQSIDDQTWKNTDYVYDFSLKRAQALEPTLAVHDTMTVQMVTGTKLFLVGPKADKVPTEGRRLEVSQVPKPEWAERMAGVDKKAGRRYGVGRFSLEGNSADAWVKAEELAIFHLLLAQQLKIGQWLRKVQNGDSEQLARLQWVKLNYLIRTMRIDGRWVDPNDGDALVAVSAPLNSIRPME